MAFRRKVFISQKITLLVKGKELHLQALVSTYGVKYVFEESELPREVREAMGDEVEILYKKIPVRCRVVKETNHGGTVYSLRFINASGLLIRQIERDIKESGLPSPWLRSLPRLTTEAKHLPVPALAVLHFEGNTIFLNVKNFTLGGLLLEYVGADLGEAKSGELFEFDLVTNAGDKIADLRGLVTHVSVEASIPDGGPGRRQFGLRFLPMNMLSENKYRALIAEHCRGLKVEPMENNGEI